AQGPAPLQTATVSFVVNNDAPNPGPLTVAADVGDDGTVDWAWSGAPAYPARLTTGNLTAAFNAYLSGRSGEVDVPIRFYLAPFLGLALADFTATPTAQPDLQPANLQPGTADPTEGDTITVNATIHNSGSLDTGPLTAAFYATPPNVGGQGGAAWYLGAAFVSNVTAGGTTQASIPWNTLGFTGTTPIRVVVDPYNRITELSETNNVATATLTIRTRPDLNIPTIALSNNEPVVSQTVTVTLTLRNRGQTAAGPQWIALYRGAPESGPIIGQSQALPLPGGVTTTMVFTWTPAAPGPVRLFARADRDGEVNEYDESNNDAWRDLYVGFRGPILVDSGGPSDPPYSATLGYGYISTGTRVVSCGLGPESTLRAASTNAISYRFDHLLPGHFYHLDLTLRDCDGNRAEAVYVDDMLVVPAVDLSDHRPHRLSILLDPALYADHTFVATISEMHGLDAMVAEINLHDVDYRYADAGSSNSIRDPQYPGARGYGWLDGEPLTSWGSLPYQTVRMDRADTNPNDDPDNELRYRFDQLDPSRRYRLRLTFRQGSGATIIQKVQIDGTDASPSFNLDNGQTVSMTVTVPASAYQADGSIIVGIVRMDCASSEALVNEIALEEETLMTQPTCNVSSTPYRTIAHGSLTIGGMPAPVGTVVEALNRDDVVVGCVIVQQAGIYGYMQIYGEDAPTIPGMRAGELVKFRVNGIPAIARPSLYWQDDKAPHQVNLATGSTDGQCSYLNANWNLISFRMEPPVPSVGDVLRAIQGRYCRVLSETGIYDCALNPVYRTLKEMHPGQGYWLKVEGGSGANLRVEGISLPADTPIPLHQYWNWIGYYPSTAMPITTALQSIAGHYQRVLSRDKTYDPAHPELSDLWTLEPGQGYQILATAPVTLTYPASLEVAQQAASRWSPAMSNTCQHVSPTPYRTLLYGALTINGQPAPAGTRVEIVTPRGDVAGCFVTRQAGLYGYVQVYGEDHSPPLLPGFRLGEPLAFRVNGLPAIPMGTMSWQDDLSPHAVNLNATRNEVYLPLILK
ncbi:MAG: hypothetical protein N2045_13975, partial [Fimbriimonadales bacterium]|nr:hypothetical protein [Fimbriimonadales bacterium]